jgi:hypothetical protein
LRNFSDLSSFWVLFVILRFLVILVQRFLDCKDFYEQFFENNVLFLGLGHYLIKRKICDVS